ncbi:MAG: hypothetical protein ABIP03_09095 [Aquihabitans sp.]
MGAELFGADGFVLYAVGCVIAYVFSSHRGIYTSQRLAVAQGTGGQVIDREDLQTLHLLGRSRRHWLQGRRVGGDPGGSPRLR